MQSWVLRGLVFVVWITLAVEETSAQKNVVCYFSSWAVYRPGNGKFDVENIDPFLCTHVIYAFVGLNWDGTVRVMDTWNELDLKALTRFTGLKKTNPNLKTLVAIGGWNEGSVVFSQVAGDAALRAKFVTSAYDFVKANGFDGLDVDWEYPAQRGGAAADKANFVTLLKDLSAKFVPANLMLSIAVSASVASVSVSYNIPEIIKYVNFVNLMTYDFHGSWEKTAGINSPLYPSSIDTDLTINGDAAVRYWIQQGAPPLKLLLGAPMFGRTYTLLNANSPGIGAATTGPGAVGPYTQESGFIGYNELCESMKTTTWNVNWATQQKVPFAFKGTQWVGYDNKESVRIKAEYAKWKGIGGMLVWGIETDDSRNICGGGTFPLINTIKSSLNSAGVSADAYPATQGPWMPSTVVWADPAATTTKAPVTTTTATTTKAPVTTTTATTTKAPVTTTTATTTKAPVTTTTATTTKAPVTTTTVTTTKAPVTTTTATTTQAPITTTATTTTKAPVTSTTTKAPTTTASSTSFKCTTVGYFRDPTNCAVYYYCQAVTGGYNAIRFQCDPGLVYDTVLKVCNYPYNVQC